MKYLKTFEAKHSIMDIENIIKDFLTKFENFIENNNSEYIDAMN